MDFKKEALNMTAKKDTRIPDKIKKSIDGVMELLNSGHLPEAMSKIVFKASDKPMSAWSMSNTLMVALDYIYTNYHDELIEIDKAGGKRAGFIFSKLGEALDKADYRGFNQWKEIGRNVKKGEIATAYILAPMFKKYTKRYYLNETGKQYLGKDEQAPEGKKSETENGTFIYGFRGIPVFEAKQTNGKAIKYKPLKLPQLPFMPVAEFLNIKVVPRAFRNDYYGSYSPDYKVIQLCTPDETTFFHELSHAVDDYLLKKTTGKGLKGGQQKDQEIIAQFCANVIAYMRGYRINESTAYTKKYLERYANGQAIEEALMSLMSRIEKIIDFITNFKQAKSPSRQSEEQQGEEPSDVEKLADNPPKPDGKTGAIVGSASDGRKVTILTATHKTLNDGPEGE